METKTLIKKNSVLLFPLVFFSSLMVFRAPYLIIYPRFWAEEGSVHFKYAFENGFFDNLFFVYWRAGYYNFIANIASSTASLFLLEHSPLITTCFAFLVQVGLFIVIIYGNSLVFTSYTKKIIGCLIILFSPLTIGEIWLNTINSQVWFGVIGVLILLEKFEELPKPLALFYRTCLLVGGLSGFYLVVLYPLFLIRYLLHKNKDYFVNILLLTFTLCIQLYVFFVSVKNYQLNEKRFLEVGLHSLYAVYSNQIMIPILGKEVYHNFIFSYEKYFSIPILIGVFLLSVIWVFKCLIKYKDNNEANILLVLAWFILAIFTIFASFHGNPAGKYSTISSYVVLFLLLHSIKRNMKLASSITIFLLFLSLLSGFANYKNYNRSLNCNGLNWKHDIDIWKANDSYKIHICPRNWTLKLQKSNLQ